MINSLLKYGSRNVRSRRARDVCLTFVAFPCLVILLTACDKGGGVIVTNNLEEQVNVTVVTIPSSYTLPFNLAAYYGDDWPNRGGNLDVGATERFSALTVFNDRRLSTRVLVSAWTSDGRVLFEETYSWDEVNPSHIDNGWEFPVNLEIQAD